VNIDRLRWWHLDEVLAIEEDLFGEERWTPAMFWGELASGHYYVAAFEGEEILGYAGLAVSGSEAWVNNIAVRREAQRRSIGRALLDELLARARQVGASAVLLEVAVDNIPAQRLYDAYGFEAIAVRRGYYQPSNTDAVVMRKDKP
jgi:[ribosomal protein S18]-alanine N-acetyltransferase